MRHPALNNVMQNKSYEIKQAIVLCNENIEMKDQIFTVRFTWRVC